MKGGGVMRNLFKFLTVFILILLAGGCASGPTPSHYEGGAAGAVIGGIAGALLDHNHWRGGVIGGAIGALAGVTFAELSQRAAQDASYSGRPVEYRSDDGRYSYRAQPLGPYDGRTRCRKVEEKVWQDGTLVKNEVREICEGPRYERRY
jgi:outer membrane lipoprotein SlyB